MDFRNKNYSLITGSDSGIRQSTAIAFAREGAGVVITYHSNRKHPLKARWQARRIAKVAVFPDPANSDYVNGSTYVIDGGLMRNVGQGA